MPIEGDNPVTKAIRLAPFTLLVATILAGPALAQAVGTVPKTKPAAAPAKALVSTSPVPTFDEGTVPRIAAAMLSYSTIEVRGGWPTLPATAKLAPGSRGPDVALLRERLAFTDDLPADKAAGDLYDDAVAAGVRRFQARHGLEETGSVGPKTLAALNVPVGNRLRQLAASLDRLVAMDFTFGQRYVVVNIPAAFAEAVDGDKVVRRYVVVVGKPDRPSPTLTTHITTVNLNPTWTVPLSIMKKDIITKMRKDPGYVDRMHMRDLDAWLLDDNPGWSRREIDAAIAKGQRTDIRLTRKVPVAWIYLTGWATRDGAIHFRDDVYHHDEKPALVADARPRIASAARASGFVLQSADTRPAPVSQVSYLDSQ